MLFFAVNAAMQRAEQALSQRKFNADERLVSKVLEYVQGIAEVKNFDLTHDSATKVHGAVEEARKASFAMELPSVLYMLVQFIINKLSDGERQRISIARAIMKMRLSSFWTRPRPMLTRKIQRIYRHPKESRRLEPCRIKVKSL